MSDTILYLGEPYEWEDTSNPAVYINNQADAKAILIKESANQTVPSFSIQDSTGSVVFAIVGGVVTTAASPVTSTVSQTITVNSLTTGSGLLIQSSATAITTTGRMFQVAHTGTTGTSATLSEFISAANDETVILQIKASDVLALGTALNISVAAMTTGSGIVITPTALTTGKAISITDLAALTTGIGLNITSAATAIATTGRMVFVNHTGVTGTSAVLSEFKSAANDETIIFRITATDVLALGKALDLQLGSMTTGSGIVITPTAMTTGKALSITDLGALTTGMGISVTSAATAIATTGRLLSVAHTGTTGTSAVLSEFITAANDETVVVQIKASDVLALGIALNIDVAAMTTGSGIVITPTAMTTGKAISITDLGALTTGIGLNITSAATAIATTGRMVFVNHTGTTGTSAILSEFKSAAADETVIFQVTASAALALGKAMFISCAALTTGIALDISGSVATTTGTLINVNDNSSDTGTRTLVSIKQDHASASGATPLTILNDNATKPLIAGTATATSTNYFKFSTVNGVTIWIGNGTTANGNLSGTAGDICLNAGSNKPEYCTGTTSWTALV